MWYDSLEGVQFDKNNGRDLASWCGGELIMLTPSTKESVITVTTARGEILIRQGDWVAKDAEGRFRIVRLNPLDLGKELNRPKPKPRPRPRKSNTNLRPVPNNPA